MAKQEYFKINTPPGELIWVNISGKGKENYNKDGYEYTATVLLSGSEAQKVIKQIQAVEATVKGEATAKSVSYGVYTQGKNKEGKDIMRVVKPWEFTGTIDDETVYAFQFKTKVTDEEGEPKVIAVWDSEPKKIKLKESIGNGSRGSIGGVLTLYEKPRDYSVSAYLNAIQLTKFVPYTQGANFESQDGYVQEEAGFVGQEATEDQVKEEPRSIPRL